MKKKYLIILFSFITLIFTLNIFIKIRKLSSLSDNCLTEKFNKEFKFDSINKLKLNFEYDFDEIFDCKEWDEILVVQAPYINRTLLYIKSGIILPGYDYINSSEDSHFLFFINNGNVITKPIRFGSNNFIFSNNFKTSNYLKSSRENSKFKYKRFENSHYDGLFTLELSGNKSN